MTSTRAHSNACVNFQDLSKTSVQEDSEYELQNKNKQYGTKYWFIFC